MNTKTEVKNPAVEVPKILAKAIQAAPNAAVQSSKGNAMATTTPDTSTAAAPAVAQPSKADTSAKRLEELHGKTLTAMGLSDEEQTEYFSLITAKNKSAAAHRKALSDMVDSFVKSGIVFADFYKAVVAKNDGQRAEITSLFTAEEIKAAAGAGGSVKGPKAPKKDNSGVLLKIKVDGKLGKPTTYAKGQAIQSPQRAFREIYEKDTKNFAENLKKYYEPGAAEYFETDAGKEELKKFIEKTTRPVTQRATTK